MMINKRLIGTVPDSRKYIAGNVVLQWCSLVANIVMMAAITGLLGGLAAGKTETNRILTTLAVVLAAVAVRFVCSIFVSRMGYLSFKAVKQRLREMIYEK